MRAERATKADLTERLRVAEEKALLADVKFQRWVFTFLREAGVFYPTTTGTPHSTAIQAGRQSLGLEVLHRLSKADPERVTLIMAQVAVQQAAQPQEQPDDDRDEPES